jgi:2-methylcitrate dehydratase PrpD
MDASHALTDHALGLNWTDISPSARRAAATFLHDSLAVGIAGVRAPHADQVLGVAAAWGGVGPCAILGREVRLPAPDAAFVNAFQIHSQEYDCVHEPAVVHPLATIVAVLLAEIDRSGPYSGAEVLTALVAGVDVSAGLGIAVTTPLRFFRPATAGIFGSIAALARLRGLPRAVTMNALGYGLAFASGTMQAHVEGKPTLPVQIAQAARSAIQAIDLAVVGLPGPQASIEGPFGYLTLFETAYDIDRLHEGLGAVFRIEEVSWKPFPTGRAAHGAVVATQALMRDHGLTADNLVSLVYRAPSLIHRLVGRPATPAMTPAYARLCFAYLAGAVLEHGTVGLDDFTPDKLSDPARLATAAKVTVEADDNPDPAAFTPATAKAHLTDGRVIEVGVAHQFGSPAWPLSRDQHLEKARACLAFAGLEPLHGPLVELMETLDAVCDLGAALRSVLQRPTP